MDTVTTKVRMELHNPGVASLVCTVCRHVFLEIGSFGHVDSLADMAQLGELLVNHAHAHDVYA